jgi:hypothetical protein
MSKRSGAIAFDVGALARNNHAWRSQPAGGRVCRDGLHLPRLDPLLNRCRPREATGQQRSALKPGSGPQYLADMGVRGTLLDEHVVAVVPARHQTQVMDRREHRRPRSHHAPDVAAQHLQPRRVTSLRALPRGEPDVLTRPEQQRKSLVDPLDVPVVGNDDQGTPACRKRGRGRHGHRDRPV